MRQKKKEKEEARRMRADGITIPGIANQLGVAMSSVSVWVRDVQLAQEQKREIKEGGLHRGQLTKRSRGLYQPYTTTMLPWFEALNTKGKGNISVLNVMLILMKRGNTISVPFGDNERYDFIWDDQKKLQRVQVKSGRLRGGCVRFTTMSKGEYFKPGHHPKSYKGQIEYFGVYCPGNNKCYLVPIEDTETEDGASLREMALRVEPTRSGQKKNIRWASKYEIA